MTTCFVMQAFDNGAYDTRYEETFAPAIQAGGATPRRADKILGTKPIIEKVEEAIRSSTIALAEVSEDNPNVFLEVGYAISLRIPLILICDRSKREHLPFDIGHRPVLFYRTESQGGYTKIGREIETAVGAALLEASEIAKAQATTTFVSADPQTMDELKQRIMLEILESQMGESIGPSGNRIMNALASLGYTQGLTSLALLSLEENNLVAAIQDADFNGDAFTAYNLTDDGKRMLLGRYAEIKRAEENRSKVIRTPKNPAFDKPASFDDLDDDVPF